MTKELLVQLGGPVAAVGLVWLILWSHPAVRLGGLLLAVVGVCLMIPLLLPSSDPVKLAGVGAAALAVAILLAVVFHRWPWAFGLLAIAAAPARIPVTLGDADANLLVPLYAIVASGALKLAYELLCDRVWARELGFLAWPVAAFAGWLAASAVWADSHREAAIDVAFFVVPFALLAVLVSRLPWKRTALSSAYTLLVTLAVAFAGVGIYQWVAREIFWNPKVEVFNAFRTPFRVNSVFWDPSIYGRFLVVAILVSLAVLLLGGARRRALALAIGGAIAVMWIGLLFSFSQSSFAALALGTVLLILLVWRWRALIAISLALAVLVPVVALAPQFDNVRPVVFAGREGGLDSATGGRYGQMKSGVHLARENPVLGVGLGGYLNAYAEQENLQRAPGRLAQHASPVTVAAETGLPGLALFVALAAAGLATSLRAARGSPLSRITALSASAIFAAIMIHSLFYSAFFEDPMMWGALGLAALALGNREVVEEPKRTRERARVERPPPRPVRSGWPLSDPPA
ncbi:MAG: O-antigen ligase family protein [Actinomycetia bacterium]|nr:O-antigen ligase family protein [Actinomycetes bacterium]